MKKKNFLMICILSFVIVALSGPISKSTASTAQEVIKLKFSTYLVADHPVAVAAQQFCAEIKKRTNGRVEILFYPNGTVLSATKTYQGVASGIADIGMSNISYTRGRFPVMELLDLPMGFSSAHVATKVDNEFYNKFKPKDFDNVHLLYLHGCSPYVIFTTKKPVRTLEDLRGMKIGGKGRIADTLKTLGAVPVPVEAADYYESLQRGIVEGMALPSNLLKDWKLGEVVKYSTNVQSLGSVYTFYVVFNLEKWNNLPSDIKKIIDEVSSEWQEKTATAWSGAANDGIAFLLTRGGQTIDLSVQESAKWQKAASPIITSYVKEMEAAGHKRTDIEGYLKFVRERINYWSNKDRDVGPSK